jgi:hypothetical protein
VLLTKPKNLFFERYCLQFYENLVEFLLANLEKPSTLENDLAMLDSYASQQGEESKDQQMSWCQRMCVTYRAGKK